MQCYKPTDKFCFLLCIGGNAHAINDMGSNQSEGNKGKQTARAEYCKMSEVWGKGDFSSETIRKRNTSWYTESLP